MSEVTIEGSSTSPSTFLARGERRTVQLTSRVKRLINRGFVIVVSKKADPEPEPDLLTELERHADAEAQKARDELGVPARSASREDWAEFLGTGDREGRFVTEGKTRTELIAEWDAFDPEA